MYYFNLLIKWPYQRFKRGYDDRIEWGFDSYFINILPPLVGFCNRHIKDKKYVELNPNRAKVYKETVRLIEDWKEKDFSTPTDYWGADDVKMHKMFSYIGEHIGWYWD